MKTNQQIHLPGGDSQIRYTLGNIDLKDKRILVMGSGSEVVAEELLLSSAANVELIVEDYDSLLNSKLILENSDSIFPKMMNFEVTDFKNDYFDIIYAQASISGNRRNKIVKEIKRILKNDGILVVGEIIKHEKIVPQFVSDMFEESNLDPLFIDEIKNFYSNRHFIVRDIMDYSKTLKSYYTSNLEKLTSSRKELSDREKSYYKKILNQISHQSKAYLQQGADKYIGFCTIIAIVNKR